MRKTTIIVEDKTRDMLKQIGSKGQSYDDLIKKLIEGKRSGGQLAYGAEPDKK